MRIGTSYKQHGAGGTYDAIVIGSGIGGLTAAALLAEHAGKRVLVLEQHYTAGGFTHTFHRPGYEWDVGVHYIGQTDPRTLMRRAFDHLTDGELEWADMGDVYDTIIIGDDRYELVKGRRNWRARMLDYFPGEDAAIDGYLDRVARTVKASRLYFAEKAVPGPVARLAGPLMRYPMMRHARKTTLEVLSELTDNQRLIAVLAGQYGDYGLPPAQSSFFIHALVVNHYFGGGAYPVGGSSRIAATILPVIERKGGKVVTSARVDQILVEDDRAVGVRMADGNELRAPMVISDAGVDNTFARLVPEPVAAGHGFQRQLRRVGPSVAHASLYLGLDKTADQLGLSKSNLWIYPHDDHDAAVAAYARDPNAPLPVAYVSFPSAKDPDFENRYPGKATIEVITLAPYERFARWDGTRWKKRGADYDARKQQLTDRMLEALYGQCPQVEAAVDHCELSTPLSTQHFAAFARGEIYGLAHTPRRFAERWLRPRTPIRGLYLTGADICTAGVGGALFGGVLTASAVLGKNLIGAILKAPRPAKKPKPTAAVSDAA
jgi:all-trans-retinol 13,14-reductase